MTETRTTEDIELVYTAGAVRLGTRPMIAKDEFRGWLNEIRAEAWDEGYNSSGSNQANHENWMCGVISKEDLQKRYRANPYRTNEK